MNTSPSPSTVFGILDRLSIGVSRTSIRHGQVTRRWQRPHPEKTGFAPGHGEQIWVFNHIFQGMVVYSHEPVPKQNKALKQIPFTYKSQKPTKLRKDYWRPMAMIQFPKGLGMVGQNVFQKLREYRMQHELSWDWQTEEFAAAENKFERGRMILRQKANSVADMAAVLAGKGRGNLMWKSKIDEKVNGKRITLAGEVQTTAAEGQDDGGSKELVTEEEAAGEADGQGDNLLSVKVYWAELRDVEWAQKWTSNVTHLDGIAQQRRRESSLWWKGKKGSIKPPADAVNAVNAAAVEEGPSVGAQ